MRVITGPAVIEGLFPVASQVERNRIWRQKNAAKANATKRRWRAANPEKHLACVLKRRSAKGSATAAQIAARVAFYGNRRAYCGGPYEHLDHVIPLSRGGTNWPSNLRPACAPCNLTKYNKRRPKALVGGLG